MKTFADCLAAVAAVCIVAIWLLPYPAFMAAGCIGVVAGLAANIIRKN